MTVTGRRTSSVRLTDAEISRFEDEGFLSVDRPLVPRPELQRARELLDALFASPERLPAANVRDLAEGGTGSTPQIDNPRLLEPELTETPAFTAARDLACQLLRTERVRCTYDHVIYKPPHNLAATDWHQDLAYEGDHPKVGTVHLWMPFQDVSVASGCMQFIPGSHRIGLQEHRHRSPAAHALRTEVDGGAAVACPIPAGGVTVHTPTTLHYTGPNTTDDVRRAWVLHFGADGRPGWVRTLSDSRVGTARRTAMLRIPGRHRPPEAG